MNLSCRAVLQAENRRADLQPHEYENPSMKKKVIVLGSTGSIGRSALEVLAGLKDDWDVVGLAAGSRWRQLADQAVQLQPRAVAITDEANAGALESSLNGQTTVMTGDDALVRLVDEVPCDCVVSAVVGTEGLLATLRAVEQGRRIALANKEALVVAGSILMPLAEKTGAEIIPVDSEHSAIFQAMQAGRSADVRKVYLTSSGGPFRTNSDAEMDDITLEDALRHPTWEMGPKITIDSATMMNKALEIVEAKWLFGLDSEQIEVVIHPESVIHSFVEFCDGAIHYRDIARITETVLGKHEFHPSPTWEQLMAMDRWARDEVARCTVG